jgi:hypothetical protein
VKVRPGGPYGLRNQTAGHRKKAQQHD